MNLKKKKTCTLKLPTSAKSPLLTPKEESSLLIKFVLSSNSKQGWLISFYDFINYSPTLYVDKIFSAPPHLPKPTYRTLKVDVSSRLFYVSAYPTCTFYSINGATSRWGTKHANWTKSNCSLLSIFRGVAFFFFETSKQKNHRSTSWALKFSWGFCLI